MAQRFFPLFILLFCFIPQQAQAEIWANQFVEFELPSKWQCRLEGAEWVCQSLDQGKKRDAIIILAAKLKGDQDSIQNYLAYLKKPKIYKSIRGKPVRSEPKYTKVTGIHSHDWVDSLHLESEIPGFYTRYLATVKKDIGVLVSYSINQTKYKDYLKEFEKMVSSLKVFRKTGGLNVAKRDSDIFRIAKPQNMQSSTVFPTAEPAKKERPKTVASEDDDLSFYLIVIGVALVIFVIMRRRRRRPQSDF